MQRGDGSLVMASWNGSLRIAKKLIRLGLDVNEAHFVGSACPGFVFVSHCLLFSAAIPLCTAQLPKGISN